MRELPLADLRRAVPARFELEPDLHVPGLVRLTDDGWIEAEWVEGPDHSKPRPWERREGAAWVPADTGFGRLWLFEPWIRRATYPLGSDRMSHVVLGTGTAVLASQTPPVATGDLHAEWEGVGRWLGQFQWEQELDQADDGRMRSVTIRTKDVDPINVLLPDGRSMGVSSSWSIDRSKWTPEPERLGSRTITEVEIGPGGLAGAVGDLRSVRWLMGVCCQRRVVAQNVAICCEDEVLPMYDRGLCHEDDQGPGSSSERQPLATLVELGAAGLSQWIALMPHNAVVVGALAFEFEHRRLPLEAELLTLMSAVEAWGKRLNEVDALRGGRPWPVSLFASIGWPPEDADEARAWGCRLWGQYLQFKHEFRTEMEPHELSRDLRLASAVLTASLLQNVSAGAVSGTKVVRRTGAWDALHRDGAQPAAHATGCKCEWPK